MPAPRIQINHDGLQKAFNALADYLDSKEKGGGSISLTGDDVIEGLPGKFSIASQAKDSELGGIWQLRRNKDKLYISPGYVHVYTSGGSKLAAVYPPDLENVSVFNSIRPFWNLPLAEEETYKVYLVVAPEEDDGNPTEETGTVTGADPNTGAGPSSSATAAWLELMLSSVSTEDVFPEDAKVILLHKFSTNAEGYPIFSDSTQKLFSEPVIVPDVIRWCHITQASVDTVTEEEGSGTTGTVNIAEGCVMVGDAGAVDETDPVPSKVLTRLIVDDVFLPAELEDAEVVHEDKIYVKLTYTVNEYGDTSTVRLLECTSAEYLITSSAPEDDDTASHILIGEISIVDGVMTIEHHWPGVITAPTLTLPVEGTDDAAISQSCYWAAEIIAPGAISIGRGLLIYWEYYWVTETLSSVTQGLITSFAETGGTPSASDIQVGVAVDPIADGDFVWLSVPVGWASRQVLTSEYTAAEPNHHHEYYEDYSRINLSGDAPFLDFGDELPAPVEGGDTIYPIGQYVNSTTWVQFHIGALIIPSFATNNSTPNE